DFNEHGEKFLDEIQVLSRRVILAHRLEIPQCGVNRVVLWRAAGIREIVWQHPSIDVARKGLQNFSRDLRATEGQRQSRKRDHGVAAPIAKPVITGNEG